MIFLINFLSNSFFSLKSAVKAPFGRIEEKGDGLNEIRKEARSNKKQEGRRRMVLL